MNIACRAAVGLVVFLPAAVPLPAAAQSVQITGVVVDATGGVLPGANVTLRGGPVGLREVQADASGRYTFTGVAPGTYAVTVFLAGFGPATVSKGDWTLTLYADNVLDEYAVTGVRQTPGQIGRTDDGFRSRRYFANVLAPRRVGARIRYTFG